MFENLKEVTNMKEFLLAQFSAEAYLDGLDGELWDMTITEEDVERDYTDPQTLIGRLALGPNDYRYGYKIKDDLSENERERWNSKAATKQMIKDFGSTFTVIDHLSNTSSGFSATLLLNKKTNEYTLSFRSTESKESGDGGDVLRDSSSGANGEIGKEGFAWAQIMDMR